MGSRGIKLSKLSRRPSASVLSKVPRVTPVFGALTDEGRTLLAQLLEHGIGLHSELKTVKNLDWRGVGIRLASRHAVQGSDLRYFSENGSGYAEAVARRYLELHASRPLWFNTVCSTTKWKAVVRRKAEGRINAALKQALRNAGYDAWGARLSDDALRRHAEVVGARAVVDAAATSVIAQLVGAVEILVHQPDGIVDAPFVAVRNYCARVVLVLEEQCGKTADGQRARPRTGASPQGGGSRPQQKTQRAQPDSRKQR